MGGEAAKLRRLHFSEIRPQESKPACSRSLGRSRGVKTLSEGPDCRAAFVLSGGAGDRLMCGVLSFSTCWNSGRHTSGEEMVLEILDLGFDRIELGHGLRAPMVAELLEAKEKLGFEVSSVHSLTL